MRSRNRRGLHRKSHPFGSGAPLASIPDRSRKTSPMDLRHAECQCASRSCPRARHQNRRATFLAGLGKPGHRRNETRSLRLMSVLRVSSGTGSMSIWAQKKWDVVWRVRLRFRYFVRLILQAGPCHRVRVARTANNHLLTANHDYDVANPGSRITSDGNLRRGEHLAHGLLKESQPFLRALVSASSLPLVCSCAWLGSPPHSLFWRNTKPIKQHHQDGSGYDQPNGDIASRRASPISLPSVFGDAAVPDPLLSEKLSAHGICGSAGLPRTGADPVEAGERPLAVLPPFPPALAVSPHSFPRRLSASGPKRLW
jgi:hypothetical protein